MLAFIGGIGLPEMIFFGVIVLLLFGSRLPNAMRSLGSSVVEFKKGIRDSGEEPEESRESDTAARSA